MSNIGYSDESDGDSGRVYDVDSSTASLDSRSEGHVAVKLYCHQNTGLNRTPRWSRYRYPHKEQADLMKSVSKEPIVHRYFLSEGKWLTESFTINDPLMREHIQDALVNYQDFDPERQRWTFEPPYKPLVHRWGRLKELSTEESDDNESGQALAELLTFLEPIILGYTKQRDEVENSGRVGFNHLWQVFAPGDLAITPIFGEDMVGRTTRAILRQTDGKKVTQWWDIVLEYIDWNGKTWGFSHKTIEIPFFAGLQSIKKLPVQPLRFVYSAESIKERLIRRGRQWEQLRGYHFKAYNGREVPFERSEERLVSGRVIIDAHACNVAHRKMPNSLLPPRAGPEDRGLKEREPIVWTLGTGKPPGYPAKIVPGHFPSPIPGNHPKPVPGYHNNPGLGHCPPSGPRGMPRHVYEPATYDSDEEGPSPPHHQRESGTGSTTMDASVDVTKRTENLDALTDEECLMTCPWVLGMNLKTKVWARYCVDNLSPVAWNDAAFENLVLPGNQKQLAWKFVENKNLPQNKFDDFVEDKGRGIIILMFGPPGVGKTYTAEGVAERARVPLYNMSAANLGTNPATVEEALKEALELCKLWNAMLLLDEAEVFLGTRTNNELTRNELVAVFLSQLEYYEGICFMTTNRASTIDPAFQSRVDLFLRYTDLTVDARRSVWKGFISKAGDADRFSISDAELDQLAALPLNGREIKNLVKTAYLLGLKDTAKIDMSILTMLADNRIEALSTLTMKG